jgi:hypothetical protein
MERTKVLSLLLTSDFDIVTGAHHSTNHPLLDRRVFVTVPPVPACARVKVDRASFLASSLAQPLKGLATLVIVDEVKQVNALANFGKSPLMVIDFEKGVLLFMLQTGRFSIELLAINGYINNSHILLLLSWFCLHRYYNIFVLKVKIFFKNV